MARLKALFGNADCMALPKPLALLWDMDREVVDHSQAVLHMGELLGVLDELQHDPGTVAVAELGSAERRKAKERAQSPPAERCQLCRVPAKNNLRANISPKVSQRLDRTDMQWPQRLGHSNCVRMRLGSPDDN